MEEGVINLLYSLTVQDEFTASLPTRFHRHEVRVNLYRVDLTRRTVLPSPELCQEQPKLNGCWQQVMAMDFLPKSVIYTQKTGKEKSCLRVTGDANVLIPADTRQTGYPKGTLIAAANSAGKLLIFSSDQIAQMTKGKGLKIIGIPPKKFKAGKERLVSVVVLNSKDSLRVYSGKKPKIIRPEDFHHFLSDRGKRGRSVPPFKKIDSLAIEPK